MIIKYLVCFVSVTLTTVIAALNLYKNYVLIILLLTAYIVLMLLLTVVFWRHEVHDLQKNNDKLRNGLNATIVSRDKAQKERDRLENKYCQLANSREQVSFLANTIAPLLSKTNLEDENGEKRKHIPDSSDR